VCECVFDEEEEGGSIVECSTGQITAAVNIPDLHFIPEIPMQQ
jgi:hypothetical protein